MKLVSVTPPFRNRGGTGRNRCSFLGENWCSAIHTAALVCPWKTSARRTKARRSEFSRFPFISSDVDPDEPAPAGPTDRGSIIRQRALHDRAFDEGLMWVDADLKARFRRDLWDPRSRLLGDAGWILQFGGQPLRFPGKTTYRPDRDLLRVHATAKSRLE